MRTRLLVALGLILGVALALFAQSRTVSRVAAVARPRVYTGPCPADLEFIGTIFVNRRPVWVEYQWERSDGGRGPRQRVEIRSAGQSVSTMWHVGRGRERLTLWERLHVLAPTGIFSNTAQARVNCR